ncbi:MAG: hypothetical protein ACYDH2_09260 [Anaerolineaceae bacterium]
MMNQNQKIKRLSGVFFILSFTFPIISLIVGWLGRGWKVGVISGLITFGLFFLLGLIFSIWVQTPTWFTIMLPTIVGLVYGILPNFIPLPFDDAIVAVAGAIISFALALKNYTDMPKWILAPLLGAALYTLIGSLIPGPVDELIVSIISIGVAAIELNKHPLVSKNQEVLPDSITNE